MTQDFSGKNLRGRCFKGQDLTEVNFSNADIRGADFTNAILKGANFNHAKAGLQRRWTTALFIISLLLAAISGFALVFAGIFTGYLLSPEVTNQVTAVPGMTILIVFTVFFIGSIRQGEAALGAWTWTLAIALAMSVAGSAIGMVALTLAGAWNWAGVLALAGIGSWALALGGALALAGAVALAGMLTVIWVGVLVWILAEALALAGVLTVVGTETGTVALAGALALAAFGELLGGYLGWRSLIGDKNFTWNRKIAVAFNATGGTKFRTANLTEANFTQATLKSTDFRGANVTRACWFQAHKLDQVRVGDTILADPSVRDLVVNGISSNKTYIRTNLKGANLIGVDLTDANLTEADLSDATLQGACLERVNLTRTQALGTNFNAAKLTGACLEAWNIDSTTQLDGVICDYIYLLNNQQERRPSSGKFAVGDFNKLFQEVLNTVDLIFRNGIDWKAFTYSFKKLQVENEEIELAIQSIENKGDGVIIVRVNVPANMNKAKIHSEFTQNYQVALEAIKERYQAELKSKDEQITIHRQHQADLQEVIKLLANRPVNILSGVEAESKSTKGKLALIKIGKGNFKQGFPVTLQIGTEGSFPFMETIGELSSEPMILKQYNQWQLAYRKSLKAYLRLNVPTTQITNVSRSEFIKECYELAERLRKQLNLWLNCQQFRPIKERLLEQLITTEEIRVIWQTEDNQLRQLPWHLWNFFERYPKAEIGLSTLENQRVKKAYSAKAKVRILAILGDSTGINLQKDREMLEQLPDAEVIFLVEPQRKELDKQLWFQAWDILFFAGHSSSEIDGNTGQIYINRTDSLSLKDLKNALTAAIANGLQLAIFNSCDGLGLARELTNLHIPQIIVMRESVPDLVAQEFLMHFLQIFAEGQSLYLAVRQARERLQALEDRFPCATWLPVICQNPAEVPTTWQELRGRFD